MSLKKLTFDARSISLIAVAIAIALIIAQVTSKLMTANHISTNWQSGIGIACLVIGLLSMMDPEGDARVDFLDKLALFFLISGFITSSATLWTLYLKQTQNNVLLTIHIIACVIDVAFSIRQINRLR
jgi:hypothetical protein